MTYLKTRNIINLLSLHLSAKNVLCAPILPLQRAHTYLEQPLEPLQGASAKVEIIDRRRAGAAGGSSGQEQEACDEARHGRRQGREARTSGRRRTEYKGGVKRQDPRSRTRHDTINSGSI